MKTQPATSLLDELLAVRSAADAPSAEVKASIDAITAKGKEYLARVAVLREQRPAALLVKSGAEILAMDQEIALLEIGGEQAAALVPALMDQHKAQRRAEWIERLQGQRDGLVARQEEFAARFHAFYGSTAGEFLRLLEEAGEIAVASGTFNSTIARAESESGILPVQEVPAEAVSRVYRNRVSLPGAGMDGSEIADDFLYKGREVVIHDPAQPTEAMALAQQIGILQAQLAQARAELLARPRLVGQS